MCEVEYAEALQGTTAIIQEFNQAREAEQLASSRQAELQEHLGQLLAGGGDQGSITQAICASATAIGQHQKHTDKVVALQKPYDSE